MIILNRNNISQYYSLGEHKTFQKHFKTFSLKKTTFFEWY